MEAAAGALYAAENVLTGAFGFAKGILHPTLPVKATFAQVTSAPLPRKAHSISVVKGRAYIFGGEVGEGQLADNGVHVVILPSSGVLEADYYTIKPKARNEGGRVPAARKNHSSVVVGDDVYIYGGELESEADAVEEAGRIWVFSTTTSTWSLLEPTAADATAPAPRALHAAASSEEPAPKETKTDVNILPQQPPDPLQTVPEPPEPESWGTIFVAGGRALDGQTLHDLWAFDIRSRTWTSLPPPPGPARVGASMAVVGPRLYLTGGSSVGSAVPVPRGIAHLDVSGLWKFSASGGRPSKTLSSEWEALEHAEGAGPEPRSGAALLPVTTGQGRNYLVLIGGTRDPSALTSAPLDPADTPATEKTEPETTASAAAEAGSSSGVYDDVWAIQLPSAAASAASVKDTTRSAVKLGSKETHWAEVQYQYVNAAGDVVKDRPLTLSGSKGMGARVGFAAARGTEVDGASVVVWGGADEGGSVLGDGWLVTVDR